MLSRGNKKGISFQFVKKKHLTNLSDSCMIAKSGKKSIVSGTWGEDYGRDFQADFIV